MQLTINGKPQHVQARTVRDLLESLGHGTRGVAVELNREVVPRREQDTRELHEGDVVEVVTLVGGG